MLDVVNNIVTGLILIISWSYIVRKLMGHKIRINILNITLFSLTLIIVYIILKLNMGFSKTLIIYVLFTMFHKIVYSISFNKSLIFNFISVFIHFISEIILAIFTSLLKINNSILDKYLEITPLSGLLIFIIVISIYFVLEKYIKKIESTLLKDKISNIFYIILTIFIAILLSININSTTWKSNTFVINAITIIIFLIILIFLINERFNYIKVNSKFNNLFKNSQIVSSLLEKYQKINHENENDLKVIRSKAKGNKEIEEYIDLLLKEKETTKDSKWISELNKINEIGINGFLSLKINEMIDNHSKVIVNISNKVKTYDFKKLSIKEQKDLCRILGVYLDNAYDASKESTEKEITLEINMSNEKLEIIISNTFNGNLDLSKIGTYGYTTKGKGHGTGLSLVNDIINKNNLFIQNREIIKNYYFQYLYINK